MSSENNQSPGLIAGHAQYAKGAAVESVGAATGSEAWRSSGVQDKEAGLQQMKDATAERDSGGTAGALGRAEQAAGKVVGCEGMEREGRDGQETS